MRLKAVLTLAALVVGATFLACSEGDDDHSTTIVRAPVEVAPRVTCCKYDRRDDCREFPARLFEKRAFPRVHHICYEDGACLTGCPGR